MPIASVIIPTHNRAESVGLAIASVLKQTFQEFEIVVVDDGSEDRTHDVVSGFDDRRVRYLRHDCNKGVSAARNTGLLNSNGGDIVFLDDDDEWLPQKLARQLELLERGPAIVGGVYTGYFRVERATGAIISRVAPSKRGDLYDALRRENCVGTASTVVLKRECFGRTGLFDESMSYSEEYDMWIRIANNFHFECISDPMVRYSVHPNKLSTNNRIVIQALEMEIEKYGGYFAAETRSYSRRFRNLGVLHCYEGNIKRGREAFLRAIELDPLDIRHYCNLCLSFLGATTFRKVKSLRKSSFRSRTATHCDF